MIIPMDQFYTRLLFVSVSFFVCYRAFPTDSTNPSNTEPPASNLCSACNVSTPGNPYCENRGKTCNGTLNQTYPVTNIAESSVTVPVNTDIPDNDRDTDVTQITKTTYETPLKCPISVCSFFPGYCQNGGTCVRNCDAPMSMSCDCVYPYNGLTCRNTFNQTNPVTQDQGTQDTVIEPFTKPSVGNPQCELFRRYCKNGDVLCEGNFAKCVCYQNWTGESCDQSCEVFCGFGNCVEDGTCQCWQNYTKNSAGSCILRFQPLTAPPVTAPPVDCLLNCSDHGHCYVADDINQTERCVCSINYTGDFCETFSPVKDASTPVWLITMLLVVIVLFMVILILYSLYWRKMSSVISK